jgi:hypothetical protein
MTGFQTPPLEFLHTITLKHGGDCSLIGVTPDLTLYVEEVYGEGWLAQHALNLNGDILQSLDEDEGRQTHESGLELPDDGERPQTGWHTMKLNFAGPRHRGMRGAERLLDVVRGLSVQEKMAAIERLKLEIPLPLLFGLAESYVLAEAPVDEPNLYIICRRLRLAYGLPQEQLDGDGQPYDYDTQVVYATHFYDRSQELDPPLDDVLAGLPGASLHRPMDCQIAGGHLFVADGGGETCLNAVHIWRIELPPRKRKTLEQKLYG